MGRRCRAPPRRSRGRERTAPAAAHRGAAKDRGAGPMGTVAALRDGACRAPGAGMARRHVARPAGTSDASSASSCASTTRGASAPSSRAAAADSASSRARGPHHGSPRARGASSRLPPSRVTCPGGANLTARHADGNCSHHGRSSAWSRGHGDPLRRHVSRAHLAPAQGEHRDPSSFLECRAQGRRQLAVPIRDAPLDRAECSH